MNYEKIYDSLIQDAINDPKQDSYMESHHIIPKCEGGTDDRSNLVKLTARQHFLAHWLLYKIYKSSKLIYAWHNMIMIGRGQEARKVNSHLFEYVKKEKAKQASIDFSGEKNPFYGKKHSKESIDKILNSRNKTYDSDPERHQRQLAAFKAGVSKRWKGVPKTEDHKKKIGRTGLVMLKNIFTGECIRVPKEHSYDIYEWVNPYVLRNKVEGVCPHCGKHGELNATFKRWHFENCKRKE